MATFTIPDIPATLTLKHWQASKDIPQALREASSCGGALERLAKTLKQANLGALAPFLKLSPTWAQFNYIRWSKQCDDLVREIIVGGVINLRESIREVRNAAVSAEKLIDKKDPLASKSASLLRQMSQAADALLKELRPEIIEASIRDKEKQVNANMFAEAGKPLDDIKIQVAKAKVAAGHVMREPTADSYNKNIGGSSGGLSREIAGNLATLSALPSSKGIAYEGASTAARIAKGLLAQKPIPPAADKNTVTSALKNFLQNINDIVKLPKLKIPSA